MKIFSIFVQRIVKMVMLTNEEIKKRACEIAHDVKLTCGSGKLFKEVVEILKKEVNN